MVNVVIISQNSAFKKDLAEQISTLVENYTCDETLKPDIVILDGNTQKLAEIKEKFERTPIFVLLGKGDKKLPESPFLKFVFKPVALHAFLDMLRSALNLIINSEAGVLAFNGYALSILEKEIKNLKTGQKVKLTEREVSMLSYLYKQKNKTTSKTDFLTHVWGYNAETSTHTIETHIYRLRQKVEQGKDCRQLISTESGGYRLNF